MNTKFCIKLDTASECSFIQQLLFYFGYKWQENIDNIKSKPTDVHYNWGMFPWFLIVDTSSKQLSSSSCLLSPKTLQYSLSNEISKIMEAVIQNNKPSDNKPTIKPTAYLPVFEFLYKDSKTHRIAVICEKVEDNVTYIVGHFIDKFNESVDTNMILIYKVIGINLNTMKFLGFKKVDINKYNKDLIGDNKSNVLFVSFIYNNKVRIVKINTPDSYLHEESYLYVKGVDCDDNQFKSFLKTKIENNRVAFLTYTNKPNDYLASIQYLINTMRLIQQPIV